MEVSLFTLVSDGMKKFLLHILLFFAIVGVVDVCVGFGGRYLQGHAKGGSARQFDDLVMKDKHDVLILGSSRAHHHYDSPFLSDSLGLDVYNAGYDGNGVVLADGILEMVLSRYTPKMVLFDIEPAFDIHVYSKDNNHTRYINYLKPYYREKGVSQIIKDVSVEEWRKVQSGMIRYNTDILGMLVDNVIDRGTEPGGYEPMLGSIAKEPNPKTEQEHVLDSFKLAYIEKLIALCQSHDIPIVLVGSPKYGIRDSKDLNPVKEIAKMYGVRYLDYYAEPTFNEHKEWFKEPMHLNRDGARVFSKMIASDITQVLSN